MSERQTKAGNWRKIKCPGAKVCFLDNNFPLSAAHSIYQMLNSISVHQIRF